MRGRPRQRGGHAAAVRPPGAGLSVRPAHDLIDAGGPFPYEKDGSVFGNFERLLPAHQRGARRIVTGRGGEIYYTDDHYNSFRAVLR